MHFKLETWLDYFLFFIILIKIAFILSAIGHLIASRTPGDQAKKVDKQLLHWKERLEFVFIVSMSVLLIYHFKPHRGLKLPPISNETAILFYLFGWILIITAKWNLFITESPWYKAIVLASLD